MPGLPVQALYIVEAADLISKPPAGMPACPSTCQLELSTTPLSEVSAEVSLPARCCVAVCVPGQGSRLQGGCLLLRVRGVRPGWIACPVLSVTVLQYGNSGFQTIDEVQT